MPNITHREIFKKFEKKNPNLDVSDYRPYDILPNSIIVWICSDDDPYETVQLAFRYDEFMDHFTLIPNAKKFKELLKGE